MRYYLEALKQAMYIFYNAWAKIINEKLDIIYDFLLGEEKDAS